MPTSSGKRTSKSAGKKKNTILEINLKGVEAGRRRRRHIPEGMYHAKVVDVEVNHKFNSGRKGVVWIYEVTDRGPGLGARFWHNCVIIDKDGSVMTDSLWTIRGALEALTPKVKIKESLMKMDLSRTLNRTVGLEIGDDEYEGKLVSSILDVFNEDTMEEEEEDEEAEELEDEDDEEEEEEDDEEEDEEEDEDEDEDDDEEVDLEDDEL